MATLRLTAAQALVRYLAAQFVEIEGTEVPYFAGVWAIFGHGNVAGIGEALHGVREQLPTFRAHNEQAMAHAAIGFAKASKRRRAMACTSSIGPGALNMVTAAAVAHVDRLPLLLIPGDVFAGRAPDPVLQQVEDFADATVSANDCFRPVSRYFDRIQRPEQLIGSLPQALATMLDPATCGPATLAFCQDTQTEAADFPAAMFERRVWRIRRQPPDPREVNDLAAALRAAQAPLIIAGGGVIYAGAEAALAAFAERTGIPVAETQGGRGALAWDHLLALGAIGVTGTSAANRAAAAADLVIGIGTRLQDFTTGSRALFARPGVRLAQINVGAFDAAKHGALAVVGDAGAALEALAARLGGWRAPAAWARAAEDGVAAWDRDWAAATAPPEGNALPSDGQVIGAVWRQASDDAVVVCAAGGLPGELHKLWRPKRPGGYHLEYGFSCMGYEIAGGLGVKLADPAREVIVMLGDGSYLMLNSEIATSVMLGLKLTIVVLDNRGFGCINRLQAQTGGAPFNNLLAGTAPEIDFAAHAASLGALAEKVDGIAGLEAAMGRAAAAPRTYVIVIDTDPALSTAAGGAWWDVPVPEVSDRAQMQANRAAYEVMLMARQGQTIVDFGVSPIAWANDDMPELGGDTAVETILSDAAAIGFAGIELGRRFPRDPKVLAPMLASRRLCLIGGWYSLNLLIRDAEAEIAALQPHLALLKAMESWVFIAAETSNAIHSDRARPLADTPRLAAADWPRFGERLATVADYIASEGLKFAYHFHLGTVVERQADLDVFIAATPDTVGLVVDTGHAALGGVDAAALIRRHPERIVHVHAKDVRRPVFDQIMAERRSFLDGVLAGMFTAPGDGGLDFSAVLRALSDIGYDGWIVIEAEQDPKLADPRVYSRLGLKTLRAAAKAAGLIGSLDAAE